MSVRQSLLAILDQGPCYGYQLRTEFERRTGGRWPLNVGQVYNTLDRLERDGLVSNGGSDDKGHVFYEITDAGRRDVHAWLASPVEHVANAARDELIVKVALAATLPGVGLRGILEAQHRSAAARRETAERTLAEQGEPADATDWARRLLLEAEAAHAQADVAWIDRALQATADAPPAARRGIGLDTTPPRRGRPSRSADEVA